MIDKEEYELLRSARSRCLRCGITSNKQIIIKLEREIRMYREKICELLELKKQQCASERTMHMKCECDLSGLDETKKKLSECVQLADQLNNLIDRLK